MTITPKEKAEELIASYKNIKINGSYLYPSDKYCKQCALICAEEILRSKENTWTITLEYWKEVKEEIIKL